MKNNKYLQIIKLSWTLVVIVGIVYYISRNRQSFIDYINHISFLQILLSSVLLIIGKLLLTQMSLYSINSENWHPPFSKMFYYYSISQLSKYLPGGVWHFVGRFGLYRLNGLDNHKASQSIIVENIWLVSSALLFGGMICLLNQDILGMIRLSPSFELRILLMILFLIIWFTLNLAINKYLLKKKNRIAEQMVFISIQFGVWVFIGLSFFALLPVSVTSLKTAIAAIGGFSIGWATGYITIFAPSGIGVREAILATILTNYLPSQEAALFATVSRVVWVITEVSLGAFTELIIGSGNPIRIFSKQK